MKLKTVRAVGSVTQNSGPGRQSQAGQEASAVEGPQSATKASAAAGPALARRVARWRGAIVGATQATPTSYPAIAATASAAQPCPTSPAWPEVGRPDPVDDLLQKGAALVL